MAAVAAGVGERTELAVGAADQQNAGRADGFGALIAR